MKLFFWPALVALLALFLVFWWGGLSALLLAALLSILEVTLSFDNAVVNAKVLGKMSPLWQRRFLTWGILFAVFGTRLVLPVLIVSIAAVVSPLSTVLLAFENPEAYAALLFSAKPGILAFGGAFLLMLSLKYFFDAEKDVHWIAIIEKRLSRWGRVEAIEIAIALITLLALSLVSHSGATVLFAGIIGVVLFILIQGIAQSLSFDTAHAAGSGLFLFLYLNILDAAFSLDGVVGAFALTQSLPVIFVGLGIGAYFVRAITLYLVEKKTLATLRYLEHGAHWAIFGLALSMLVGLVTHVPEAVTGLIGLFFVTWAYVSSVSGGRRNF